MPTNVRLWGLLVGVALAASGCAASPVLTPTPAPTTEAPAPVVGNLPPGCDPIDLRSLTGDRIELDGTWVHSEGREMTWWIRTQGSCIWGAGTVDDVPEDPQDLSTNPATVQILSGSIQTDFVIEGEIVLVGPPGIGFEPIHAPVRLLIEVDDSGAVSIREDRVYGDQGPRCTSPPGYCLQPLVLRLQTAVGN